MGKFKVVSVSAPSKVILFGEHAVVYGMTAVAASLNLRTRMRLRPHEDCVLVNFPDVDIQESWSLAELKDLFRHKPSGDPDEVDHVYLDRIHDFIKTAKSTIGAASIICFLYLYSVMVDEVGVVPMEITVESEIPLGAGLGSSAALSVCLAAGLTGVLHQIKGVEKNIFKDRSSSVNKQVCKLAFLSEKILHGSPSGIDNSVSTYGGLCSYLKGNLQPVKIKMDLNILLVNTNSFRHTRDLVARVKERLQAYPEIIHPILKAVDGISNKFLTLVQNLGEDENEKYFFKMVGELVECNQNLLSSLGVSHPTLDDVCLSLKKLGLFGKLTGAGGGGFALAILPPNLPQKTITTAKNTLESKGYTCYQASIGGSGFMVELEK